MKNGTMINAFSRGNTNTADFKTHYQQIMATITDRVFKFKPMTKRPIVTNYTFFNVFTFNKINSFT